MKNFSFIALALVLFVVIACCGCSHSNTSRATSICENVKIYPDYTDITVPPNIAPLNFRIDSEGTRFKVEFIGENGRLFSISTSKNVIIPMKKWRRLLRENIGKSYKIQIYRKQAGVWEKFPTITNRIAHDSIDPYLTYRLIHTAYEKVEYLRMQQRHLESFKTSDIINSSVVPNTCMNCHITNAGNPNEFLMHFRRNVPATIFYKDGEYRYVNTFTPEFSNPGVYPAWHPSGRFIAFSTNDRILSFHTNASTRLETFDANGNIAVFDLETNTMLATPQLFTPDPIQETFPTWSPDGKWLYFCRAYLPNFTGTNLAPEELLSLIKYDLYRIPFDEKNLLFGNIEIVVNARAMDKSVALPRVSPNGRFLTFAMFGYGTFPTWKKDSDIYLFDRQTSELKNLKEANSCDTESYLSWSSNSRWFVVSSKRRNGLISLPYFSYIDSSGNASKPFLLPQKNPNFYETWLFSYNVPELVKGKTRTNIYDFEKAIRAPAIKANFASTPTK